MTESGNTLAGQAIARMTFLRGQSRIADDMFLDLRWTPATAALRNLAQTMSAAVCLYAGGFEGEGYNKPSRGIYFPGAAATVPSIIPARRTRQQLTDPTIFIKTIALGRANRAPAHSTTVHGRESLTKPGNHHKHTALITTSIRPGPFFKPLLPGYGARRWNHLVEGVQTPGARIVERPPPPVTNLSRPDGSEPLRRYLAESVGAVNTAITELFSTRLSGAAKPGLEHSPLKRD